MHQARVITRGDDQVGHDRRCTTRRSSLGIKTSDHPDTGKIRLNSGCQSRIRCNRRSAVGLQLRERYAQRENLRPSR